MKLVLVRHGMPDENDPLRAHDPPLSAIGRQQADQVAAFLAQEPVNRIVSSPLLRALETAEPSARWLKVDIDIVDGWAEADRDAGPYRSVETLRALGSTVWSNFLKDPVRFYGGDPAQFRSQVLGALAGTLENSDPGWTVVFTHGLPINLVLSHALGLPRITHFAPRYCSLTRLRGSEAGNLGVISVNETAHLGAVTPR